MRDPNVNDQKCLELGERHARSRLPYFRRLSRSSGDALETHARFCVPVVLPLHLRAVAALLRESLLGAFAVALPGFCRGFCLAEMDRMIRRPLPVADSGVSA